LQFPEDATWTLISCPPHVKHSVVIQLIQTNLSQLWAKKTQTT